MRETYLDLPSRLEDAFSEIDNDIMIELRNEKEEYAELLQKISDLKQKAPFLTDLLESSGEIRLTAKEYAAFTQYLHLVRQRDDITSAVIPMRWRISKKSKRFDSTHHLDDAKAICDS